MRAGRLDRRITIITPSATQDAYGEEIRNWSTLAEVWAGLRYAGQGERFTENQFQGMVDTVFSIRWSNTVKTMDVRNRVIFDNRIFDIVGIHEISRREGLEIFAYTKGEYQVAGSEADIPISNAIVWNGFQLVWGS